MKIAILGFGTVGRGAYEAVCECDCGLEVKRVLDIRVPEGFEDIVTTDYSVILNDPEIEIVAEAIGGLHPAYEFVCAALSAGKSVVSANKHLICHYFRELHELAKENGAELRFTSSVGGGIPWLYNLRRAKRCDRILWLRGIMNGTTNYILDAMQNLGSDFAEVLAAAQQLGYAESDPSADIDGLDVRRKCAISASLAFDAVYGEKDVPTFGIRNITKEDIAYFASLGMTCKLLGQAKREGDETVAYVEPTLLPADAVESAIGTNYNCITLFGEKLGRLSLIGQGAGKHPTGIALVGDMLDIANRTGGTPVCMSAPKVNRALFPHRYYIRTVAEIPADFIERRDGGAVITRPMALDEIHAYADSIAQIDPQAFFAGLEDTVE